MNTSNKDIRTVDGAHYQMARAIAQFGIDRKLHAFDQTLAIEFCEEQHVKKYQATRKEASKVINVRPYDLVYEEIKF